jgi:hypothetical protein
MDIGVYVRCSMGTRVYVAGAVWILGCMLDAEWVPGCMWQVQYGYWGVC